MKMSFRWYGETDPIPLKYIRQIPNMRSVVTAVYDVKPGKVWPEESLKKLKEQAGENGLIFDIAESVRTNTPRFTAKTFAAARNTA